MMKKKYKINKINENSIFLALTKKKSFFVVSEKFKVMMKKVSILKFYNMC
jgi:hypothetical protein